LPFEWFTFPNIPSEVDCQNTPNGPKNESIRALVLWIDEDTISDAPLILLLISARIVRRVMRDLRDTQIEQLTRAKLRKLEQALLGERITLVIEEMRSMRDGVFAPILEHPVLRAGLLPVLGLSANAIVESVAPILVAHLS
jgi:hypothetical protein